MKVLVIGGTGFIGKHVVEGLRAAGERVGVFHRRAGEPAASDILEFAGDRDRAADLTGVLRRFEPEVVVDMIVHTEGQARSLVECSRGIAQRLILISSGDVYRNYDGLRRRTDAPPDSTPLEEDGPLRETRYPYRGQGLSFDHAEDYDKIPAEQAVLGQPDLPATVLRLPAVYGPGDDQHRLRAYLKRMADGRPAILLSEGQARWRWTRGYVENVAAAIVHAARDPRAAGRVYNVGEEETLTEREWVERIAAAAGWQGEVVTTPEASLPRLLQRPFDWRYDLHLSTDRIREELGYAEPVPPDQAMRRSVEWERASLHEAEPPDYEAEDQVLSSR